MIRMKDNDTEERYKEMERAEKRAKRILKKNNYRYVAVKCCRNCKKSDAGYPEESRTCNEAEVDGWIFNQVDELGICDLYEGD